MSLSLWGLIGLLLCAIVLRVFELKLHVVVLESEGSGYAHQAQNLIAGRGFESAFGPYPDLVHCWLQPVLIAVVFQACRDLDSATHIVSLAAGTLLIFWLFLIAKRLYGIRSAWLVAILAAAHPLLVALSATGYAECLAMGLQFGAIYWSIRFFENDGRWSWLFAGILWGLSYLNRTECLPLPLGTVVVYGIWTLWNRGSKSLWLRQTGLFLLVFSLLASPYVYFLHENTGKLLFEGKNLLNYTIGERELQGMDLDLAERQLTPALQEIGPSLNTRAYVTYSPYPSHVGDLAQYFTRMAARNYRWVLHSLVATRAFGGYTLAFFASVGLLACPWNATRVFREIYMLGFTGYVAILLLASHLQTSRYAFAFLPFLLLWASVGIIRVAQFLERASVRVMRQDRNRRAVGVLSTVVVTSVLVLFPIKAVQSMWDFTSGWAPNNIEKEAGTWLRLTAPGVKYTFGPPVFCYYSASYEQILPYTDGETALRYFHLKDPDFIVLDSSYRAYTPYYDDWLKNGIPDPAAAKIYQRSFPGGRTVSVFRWNRWDENASVVRRD